MCYSACTAFLWLPLWITTWAYPQAEVLGSCCRRRLSVSAPHPAEPAEELREFAATAGQENIKFHLECAESIAKESNTTLTILFTGAGASLGYWMKLLEIGHHPDLSCGTAAVSVYLCLLAFALWYGGMSIGDIQPPTNEPKNLTLSGLTLDDVRQDELKNLQWRIEQNIHRNKIRAAWLNYVRLGVTFTPAIFGLGLGFGLLFVR